MTPERWRHVEQLYEAALAHDVSERAVFVVAACGADEALRREVESLLAQATAATGFIEGPAIAVAAQLLSTTSSASLVGRQLGPYTVLSLLGAGGMGDVYCARDTRLNRTVALKILREPDASLAPRFAREAKAIAALHHPQICALYDIGHQDGIDYLVMEHLEGETLAHRLQNGALPLERALLLATQIAEALAAAHRVGIVHRDLKPGNIMLTKSGAMLLDFGLAKTTPPSAGHRSMDPTSPLSLTEKGMILGTVQYMAPEQLEGSEVDARTDIFAFGAVVYEMLTGRRAFEGHTQASIAAAILAREPAPMCSLQPLTPVTVDRIVNSCLAKNPEDRWQSAADLARELKWLAEGTEASVPDRTARLRGGRTTSELIAWTIGALGLLAAIATWIVARPHDRATTDVRAITRFEIATPPTSEPVSFAISPNGQRLVFAATLDGVTRLWLRYLDRTTTEPLPGTEGATFPFWAPNSQAIGFFADRKLKRLDLDGGTPQVLTDAPAGRGGTWSRSGTIVFVPSTTGPLTEIAASGGTTKVVLAAVPGQGLFRWPQFLPDDQHFLFAVGLGRPDMTGVYVGSLDRSPIRLVLRSDTAASFTPPDHLLVGRQGVLVALPFDPVHMIVGDGAVPVATGVASHVLVDRSAFSVSDSGVLVHRGGSILQRRQLVWVDRLGRQIGNLGNEDETGIANPQISPDGRRVLLYRDTNGNDDLWSIDVARAGWTRLTSDPSVDASGIWAVSGNSVLFRSLRSGRYDLFEKAADGTGVEQPLLVTSNDKTPWDVSPNGVLLFSADDEHGTVHLFTMPLSGEHKPSVVALTRFDDDVGQFSPDGRWIAYQSNQSGRAEVYVQPFPRAGDKTQVSLSGGTQARWRHDGRELFFVAEGGQMMAASFKASADERSAEIGAPMPLFQTRLASGTNVSGGPAGPYPQYAVAADGRFLLNSVVAPSASSPLTVVLNWPATLKP